MQNIVLALTSEIRRQISIDKLSMMIDIIKTELDIVSARLRVS